MHCILTMVLMCFIPPHHTEKGIFVLLFFFLLKNRKKDTQFKIVDLIKFFNNIMKFLEETRMDRLRYMYIEASFKTSREKGYSEKTINQSENIVSMPLESSMINLIGIKNFSLKFLIKRLVIYWEQCESKVTG